ncbi:protein kinase [Rhodococcus sp. NPDC059968]|uniref:protein kinase domain-containing protein n=1 Tax=Rhodococcus sp. NPDC059968 TaxID=3347017 RepID=UPI00366FC1B2
MDESDEVDLPNTQRDLSRDIATELDMAGLENAEEVGRGGFGVVYRCTERSLDRTVAVKVLTSDVGPDDRTRFVREQRAMGKLSSHPHIVQILHVGVTANGSLFLVMPYHEHGSLQTLLRQKGPLPLPAVLGIGVKLAGALSAAHREGILHRDIKPANILITGYGEPQLTDFGIARIGGDFETSAGSVVGTPAFTAPEVLKGQPPSPASDVYGLGATLFCLMTGHAAFERRTREGVVAQFVRVTNQPIPDLREHGIPDDVCTAIEHAMAGDPADRPASADAFGNELRTVQLLHGLQMDAMAMPADPFRATSPPPRPGGAPASRTPAAMPNTPPTAATKFRPPTSARPLVERRRLLETLHAGAGRRLTVIHAPAGFGKSTLASQWRHALIADGMPVAWLTIDRDDNNVAWFLSHLVKAIHTALPTTAPDLERILEDHYEDAARYVLPSLINDIHDGGRAIAIVIDDWHRVTSSDTVAAMDFLLENGCHHVQVIVATRSQSGLPLSLMRVRDELVEIGPTAMRFDGAESRAFLVDVNGLTLDDQEVSSLRSSTDGWVAALQLASLSLRGRSDRMDFIAHLSGGHHAIHEYLVENVLSTLEPTILEFLLSTAITEKICGDLAGMLTHVPSGQEMLEEIERRDLFLQSIDDDREWFRYHHLFADLLHRRLERLHPGRREDLHRIAAHWFADHNMLSEAVDNALAAGDTDHALRLVEDGGMTLIEDSRMTTLLGLVAKLPPNLAVTSARLQLNIAWANILMQRPRQMRAALDLFDAALTNTEVDEAAIHALRVEAAVVQASGKLFADEIAGVQDLVTDCLHHPDAVRPFLASGAGSIASFVALYTFDFDAARRWQDWAAAYHAQTSGPFSVMYGYCLAGAAAYEQLDIPAAENYFRSAVAMTGKSGVHAHAARLAGALLGALLYEMGKIAEAEQLLDESYKLGSEGGGLVEFMLATYGTGSRVKASLRHYAEAENRLDEGARIAESLRLPRLAARMVNERIRAGLPVGDEIRSRLTGLNAYRPQADGIATITSELDEDSSIRLLLREGSLEGIERASARAKELVVSIENQARPRALIRAQLLLAVCLSAAERSAAARSVLAPVAAKCTELGLTQILLDEDARIANLLAST